MDKCMSIYLKNMCLSYRYISVTIVYKLLYLISSLMKRKNCCDSYMAYIQITAVSEVKRFGENRSGIITNLLSSHNFDTHQLYHAP